MWYGPFQILSTGRVESLSREIDTTKRFKIETEKHCDRASIGCFSFCGCCCSVAQLCPTLRLHGLQHAKLLCPSLSSEFCSNSCPLRRWCYLIISLHVSFHGYSALNILFWEWSPYLWVFLTGELNLFFISQINRHFLRQASSDP